MASAPAVRRLLGRRLVAVIEARHWFTGQRDDDPGSLLHFWLHVEGVQPLRVHGCGDLLLLGFGQPYAPYDMQEHGQTRVAPAAAPDLLAEWPGGLLLDAALLRSRTSEPVVSGVLFRFDRGDLVVASVGDEWVLTCGAVPDELVVGEWLAAAPEG